MSYAAHYPPANSPFFDARLALPRDHRRLGVCLATSAALLGLAIALLDVPLRLDFARLLPLVLDIVLEPEPEPAMTKPVARQPAVTEVPAVAPEPEATRAAPAAPPSAGSRSTEKAPPAVSPTTDKAPSAVSPTTDKAPSAGATAPAGAPTDWHQALEHASAVIVERHATPPSLHPEFDALRRLARERYAPARPGKPSQPWEEPEKDIYGRTVMRNGNCFMVLDDPSVANRDAFETFERNTVSCGFSFGKRPPENLPWVEIIRAKYPHLRDPDGSHSAADQRTVPEE